MFEMFTTSVANQADFIFHVEPSSVRSFCCVIVRVWALRNSHNGLCIAIDNAFIIFALFERVFFTVRLQLVLQNSLRGFWGWVYNRSGEIRARRDYNTTIFIPEEESTVAIVKCASYFLLLDFRSIEFSVVLISRSGLSVGFMSGTSKQSDTQKDRRMMWDEQMSSIAENSVKHS